MASEPKKRVNPEYDVASRERISEIPSTPSSRTYPAAPAAVEPPSRSSCDTFTSDPTKMSLLKPFLRVRVQIPVAVLVVATGCGEGGSSDEGPVAAVEVADAGLQGPRAIIYDQTSDVYLVSNVSGDPLEEDENGFVSRISPDGEVLSQQWIPNVGSTNRLHAPKGMAIRGDTLFIVDIDCVRIADRESGEVFETRCLDDVTSLTGIDVGPEGSLFITDSGLRLTDGQAVPSSTDAVYRLTFREGQRGATLARDPSLNHPTGIAVGSRGIFVTTAGGDLLRFTPTGDQTTILSTPGQVFEGVVFVTGGGFAYSSSADSAVYYIDASGNVNTLIDGVDAPGDLGYDPTRNRVLVPLFNENRLLFVDLTE